MGHHVLTLNGIKRAGGFENLKSRDLWAGRNVHIYSLEHGGYWREGAAGYTVHREVAGVFSFADAYERTKHCGPEKKIIYIVSARAPITGAPHDK